MPITRIGDVAGRPAPPPGFCHVTAATGDRILHLSGQVGTDETGAVVGGGLAAQTERAFHNVARTLEAAGATVDDLVKVTVYVVDWDPSKVEQLMAGGGAAMAALGLPEAAVTLVGVQTLFTPDMLVEIDAIAVAQA